jgi:ribosomal protein S18 acetylase RimI-like enzyme
MGTDLYYLYKKDISKASKIIADAFFNDPKISYYFPEKDTRKSISYFLWEFLLKDGIKNGKVISPTSNLEGISIWLPPGKEHISFWRAIRNGILKVLKQFGRLTIKLMNRTTKVANAIHKKHTPETHWYLSLLAVNPKLQGKGYASKMIYPMIQNIENEGYSIYLETNNPDNVTFYKHFGFKVLESLNIPNTPIIHWSMLK